MKLSFSLSFSLLKKVLLIFCISGMGIGFFSVWYFQYQIPDAKIYNVHYYTDSPSGPLKIQATVYEANHIMPSENVTSERPLVVLVHGFAMSKAFMLSLAIELARRGVTTISITMPGHGFSDPPFYYSSVTPTAISDAIDYMLNNSIYPIDTSRIGVIGHSMGAMAAIKAGFEDHRITATVAMAAPSENTTVTNPESEFNLNFLNETMTQYVNKTYPKNLLFVRGDEDELVYPPDAQTIMSAADGINYGTVKAGVIYDDNFTAGTSREYVHYPIMDHLTEVYDPRSVSTVMNWIGMSFGLTPQQFSGNLRYVSATRPLLIALGILGAFLLTIPVSGFLRDAFYKNRSELCESDIVLKKKNISGESKSDGINSRMNNSNDSSLKESNSKNDNSTYTTILKTSGLYFLFLGVFPALLGKILPMKWPIGHSILTDAPVPMLLLCGLFGFLLIILNKKLKWNIIRTDRLNRIPGISENDDGKKKDIAIAKYIVFFLVSIVPTVVITQYLASMGISNILIAPYRVQSFILCFLMLLPVSFATTIILRRTIYNALRNMFKKWKARIILPFITAFVAAFTLSIALAFAIGAPMSIGFVSSFGLWFAVLFAFFFIIDMFLANWIYYMEGSFILVSIIPVVVLAITMNVAFPVSV